MNADPAAQLRLLDLQAADTALAQLAHRRSSLPELAAIVDADRRLTDLGHEIAQVTANRDDTDAEQRRLDAEIDTVRSRARRDDQRLTTGGLPARELEGLQHEIMTLVRRQSALEDNALDVMEARETLDTQLVALQEQRAAVENETSQLTTRRDGAFADVDAATAQRTAERTRIAGELPDDLLALYDRIRAANGGVGAAALRQRRCEGCRIELAGNELAAVRSAAPETVVRCENCRRILVRTSDSGL